MVVIGIDDSGYTRRRPKSISDKLRSPSRHLEGVFQLQILLYKDAGFKVWRCTNPLKYTVDSLGPLTPHALPIDEAEMRLRRDADSELSLSTFILFSDLPE
jgi:hypothetical protein